MIQYIACYVFIVQVLCAPNKGAITVGRFLDKVILDYIKARPDDTLREIGLGVGLHSSKVWKYLKRLKITLKKDHTIQRT
ncbi:IS630 transposase-related protein [Candidatus Lariskella endosymbiont of Epinotia ramella]|uniref:IS630 transposase-related protein n=1 Tax=Candidatus Lariskella endosymbiont of Epinotia ramella TaxID=3066224 RepID=UPI00397763C1